MKILFVGVLDVSWSTNRPMQRELEKLGHEVVPFNYRRFATEHASKRWYSDTKIDLWLDKAASYLRRDSWIPFRLGWYFHRKGRGKMNQLLIETVRKGNFDLVLMSKTDSVNFRLIEKINQYAPTWYFFMDPMETMINVHAVEYAKRCTWTSATVSNANDYFKNSGANSFFITQGTDTELFYPERRKKELDVIFAGTAYERRVEIIDYLKNNGIGITCFGEGWDSGPIYREDLAETYREAKIILNILRFPLAQQGTGFSIRVFQGMGTGSFMLSEYCPDLERIFQRKKHLDWFKSCQECLKLIQHYLKNEDEREKIAAEGCRYVLKNYSWENIIDKILEVIEKDTVI